VGNGHEWNGSFAKAGSQVPYLRQREFTHATTKFNSCR